MSVVARLRLFVPAGMAVVLVLAGMAIDTRAAAAEAYRMSLTRIDSDVYRDDMSKLVVLTRYCYEYAYGQDAVLIYERGSSSNKVIFDRGETYDVRGVYRTNAQLERVRDDVYRDQATGRYVRTQFCYVYVYGEDALVLDDRVVFVDSRQSCDRG